MAGTVVRYIGTVIHSKLPSGVIDRLKSELLDPRYPGGLESKKKELGKDCFFTLVPGLDLDAGSTRSSFSVEVQGPDEWCPDGKEKKPSPYKDGFFRLSFTIPADYPTSCPTVETGTKIYHTHVNERWNTICPDAMRVLFWDARSADDRRIFHLLEGFRHLLAHPGPWDGPLPKSRYEKLHANMRAVRLLQTSVDEYYKKAREWTEKYAMEADEDDDDDDDDDDEDDDE